MSTMETDPQKPERTQGAHSVDRFVRRLTDAEEAQWYKNEYEKWRAAYAKDYGAVQRENERLK